jgi:hypothetical protein
MTLGLPLIPLEGGPYDGETAGTSTIENPRVSSWAYFTDRVVAHGVDGPAVYDLSDVERGGVTARMGSFARMGTE